MNRKPFILLGALLVVVGIVYFAGGFPPTGDVSGTIGGDKIKGVEQADRDVSSQMSADDVVLKDAEIAELMQSDKVQELLASESFRTLMASESFREAAASESFRELFATESFRELAATESFREMA
ncbi:MAG: hypothetical protein HKN13_13040, partial [Rhodothermales bacterium]|nr:hypothetical protein [Rhodothermales bacterium]